MSGVSLDRHVALAGWRHRRCVTAGLAVRPTAGRLWSSTCSSRKGSGCRRFHPCRLLVPPTSSNSRC